jgi:hypothetical protein
MSLASSRRGAARVGCGVGQFGLLLGDGRIERGNRLRRLAARRL